MSRQRTLFAEPRAPTSRHVRRARTAKVFRNATRLYRERVNERKCFTSGDMGPRVYRALRKPGAVCPIELRAPESERSASSAARVPAPMDTERCKCTPVQAQRPRPDRRRSTADVRFLQLFLRGESARRPIAKERRGRAFFVRDAGEIIATRRRVHRPRVRKSTAHRI